MVKKGEILHNNSHSFLVATISIEISQYFYPRLIWLDSLECHSFSSFVSADKSGCRSACRRGDVILISTTNAARTVTKALRFAPAVNVTRAKPCDCKL
jgi:hypothetical protein